MKSSCGHFAMFAAWRGWNGINLESWDFSKRTNLYSPSRIPIPHPQPFFFPFPQSVPSPASRPLPPPIQAEPPLHIYFTSYSIYFMQYSIYSVVYVLEGFSFVFYFNIRKQSDGLQSPVSFVFDDKWTKLCHCFLVTGGSFCVLILLRSLFYFHYRNTIVFPNTYWEYTKDNPGWQPFLTMFMTNFIAWRPPFPHSPVGDMCLFTSFVYTFGRL